jgi:hypothetical protein
LTVAASGRTVGERDLSDQVVRQGGKDERRFRCDHRRLDQRLREVRLPGGDQRGTCGFALKLALAEDAGAVGVIMFNEGNTTGRMNALFR